MTRVLGRINARLFFISLITEVLDMVYTTEAIEWFHFMETL
jgi:hypothetical protein